MSKDIKVTDKRMFTPEGELREEYRQLEHTPQPSPSAPTSSSPGAATPGSSPADTPSRPQPVSEPPAEGAAEGFGDEPTGRPLEIPGMSGELDSASFFDLLGVLAEPATIYLGDAELPGGQSAEDLQMARLHIDLLDVLRKKTLGNLTAQESAVLEDLLYRLRLRYVQKRG